MTGRRVRYGAAAVGFVVGCAFFGHLAATRANHDETLREARQAAQTITADQEAAADFSSHERALQERLRVLMFQLDCTSDPAHWLRDRPGTLPKSMVVQPVNAAGQWTWDLVVKPWSMDKGATAGGAVRLVCSL